MSAGTSAGTSGCLGSVLAALVDGELDHAAREKAHRHLAHCALCRAEVDGQRRLKAALSRTAPVDPSAALLARLQGLASSAAVADPAVLVTAGAAPSVRTRPARSLLPVLAGPLAPAAPSSRPAPGRPAPRPVGARHRPSVLSRRTAAGSAVAVLGVAAALALGAPPQRAVPVPTGTAPAVLVTDVTTSGPTSSSGLVGAGLLRVTDARAASLAGRPEVPVRTTTGTLVHRPVR